VRGSLWVNGVPEQKKKNLGWGSGLEFGSSLTDGDLVQGSGHEVIEENSFRREGGTGGGRVPSEVKSWPELIT